MIASPHSGELASVAPVQSLGLVGAELYSLINDCATSDHLQAVAGLVWRQLGCGSIDDAAASYLAACIEARKGSRHHRVASTVIAPLRGRVGRFFPRKPQRSPDRAASRGRRRMLGGSSVLPPDLRSQFTEGERSVLCVIAGEVKRQDQCDWPIDKIAALAGVCRTLVQNTLRKAKTLGCITVLERKRRGLKNLPNIVRIACKEWWAWLKRGFATACLIGLKAVKKVSPTEIIDLNKQESCSEKDSNERVPTPSVAPS
jgi:hypothetical protein